MWPGQPGSLAGSLALPAFPIHGDTGGCVILCERWAIRSWPDRTGYLVSSRQPPRSDLLSPEALNSRQQL